MRVADHLSRVCLAALFACILLLGCSSPQSSIEQLLNHGCTVNAPDPRACDPADTHKTTICHIPPGNPGNAHTICVGNTAVPAHLDHGDFVGTCVCEVDAGVPDGDAGSTGDPDAGTSIDAGVPSDDGGVIIE